MTKEDLELIKCKINEVGITNFPLIFLEWLDEKFMKNIGCKCKEEDKHGWTEVKCCNLCGLPIEEFWIK